MGRVVHRYDKWTLYEDAGTALLRADGDPVETLAAIRDAHEAIAAPHVPRVLEATETSLRFAVEPLADFGTAVRDGAQRKEKGKYAEGVALNDLMLDTVEQAHQAPGGPYCLGALSFSNFLIDRSGRFHLFGFGHNFPINEGTGRLNTSAGSCWAPEVLLGAPATPASDVYCLHAMLRLMLPYVSLLPAYLKAVTGVRGFLDLRRRLTQLGEDASATEPTRRIQTVAELRNRYREIRTILPNMPVADLSALESRFAGLVQRVSDPPEHSTILVDRIHRTVQITDGSTFDLQRRRVLWCIVLALADAHRLTPDAVVTYDELQALAWPEEKILRSAARSRVYVAVSDLRKRGLSEVIVKRAGGYLFAPAARIQIV